MLFIKSNNMGTTSGNGTFEHFIISEVNENRSYLK